MEVGAVACKGGSAEGEGAEAVELLDPAFGRRG